MKHGSRSTEGDERQNARMGAVVPIWRGVKWRGVKTGLEDARLAVLFVSHNLEQRSQVHARRHGHLDLTHSPSDVRCFGLATCLGRRGCVEVEVLLARELDAKGRGLGLPLRHSRTINRPRGVGLSCLLVGS